MAEAISDSDAVGSSSATTLPRRITVILSATAWTSLSLCEMNRMDVPDAARFRMIWSSSVISAGVSTAVGSSRMSSSVLGPERALTISTRCWTPTGRSSQTASGSSRSPYCSETSRTALRAALAESTPAPRVCSRPSCTLSATLKGPTSLKCWWTIPIPAAMASPGPEKAIGSPSMRISPLVGWRIP